MVSEFTDKKIQQNALHLNRFVDANLSFVRTHFANYFFSTKNIEIIPRVSDVLTILTIIVLKQQLEQEYCDYGEVDKSKFGNNILGLVCFLHLFPPFIFGY